MSSNYPPGVTGREWQISGPDVEREEAHTCGAKGIMIHNIPQLAIDRLMTARGRIVPLTQKVWPPDRPQPDPEEHRQAAIDIYQALLGAIQNISDGADVDCPWEGDVEVSYVDGVGIWHCPCCGTEYEVELPDHDDSGY
jgi:hypothetical protein